MSDKSRSWMAPPEIILLSEPSDHYGWLWIRGDRSDGYVFTQRVKVYPAEESREIIMKHCDLLRERLDSFLLATCTCPCEGGCVIHSYGGVRC